MDKIFFTLGVMLFAVLLVRELSDLFWDDDEDEEDVSDCCEGCSGTVEVCEDPIQKVPFKTVWEREKTGKERLRLYLSQDKDTLYTDSDENAEECSLSEIEPYLEYGENFMAVIDLSIKKNTMEV